MNWQQLLSTKRFGQEAYHAQRNDDIRICFLLT